MLYDIEINKILGGIMKKYLVLITLILTISNIFGQTTRYVNGDNTIAPWNGSSSDPYLDIQTAINNASSGDNIRVFSFSAGQGQYDGFDFCEKDLDIYSIGYPLPIINGDNLSTIVDMTDIDSGAPSLEGFKIIGSSTAIGIELTGFSGSTAGATIERNVIDGVGEAIYVQENDQRVYIESNELLNNDIAYFSKESSYPNAGNADYFKYNEVYDNNTGLYLGYYSDTDAMNCLLYDNDLTIDLTDDFGETHQTIELWECTITNSTWFNSDTGVYVDEYSNFTANNCIIYGNDTQIEDDGGTIAITYSNVEGGYTGTGNIDSDPFFCKETNYEFNLLEGSPCIDTGDPTDTDSDGTRLDMGCYPSNIDIKYCEGNHWNWVSFPKLDRDDDDADDATDFLELFTDWPFDLDFMLDASSVLDYTALYNVWDPTTYSAYSSKGYKLEPDDRGEYYLLSQSSATRLDPDWELDYTLYDDTRNWMGYWLPYTQNIEDGFGEFWEDVFSVDAEDWYYEYSLQLTPTSSTTNKNLVYGKSYIVTLYDNVSGFYWTDATSRSYGAPGNPRLKPQYFSFNDLPDYEAIDVMDIPANVIEIGVYEDDVCIGAVVVQNEDEQILAYSTNANRNQVALTFEVVTNSRQGSQHVANYKVMNKETGKYESRLLISGQQKSSIVLFGELEEHQNNTPVIEEVVLHGNYPNPFNPTTNISFSLPLDQDIELLVYNMKGQLVSKLVSGQYPSGSHSVTWDGKDECGKNVGSGLYFYKLITTDQVISKKMLLLK